MFMAGRMHKTLGLLAAAALLGLLSMQGMAQVPAAEPAPGAPAAALANEGQPSGHMAPAAEPGAAGGHAAEAGDSELHVLPDVPELVITIIIFGVLLLILRGAAWKPILEGLQNRENAIREGVEAAARARADAERTTRELEQKLAAAQAAAALQIQQAKADAQKLAEGIRSQAEAEATSLKDRALRDIEAAKQQAVAQINGHAADLATAIARKILQRNITVEDQDRLVSQSLEEIGKNGAALAGAR
jgi:F-type H+-transporting ATPase subunit b